MTSTLVTPNPTYVTYANQISKLRETLGGGNETPLTALPPYAIPFVPTAYMPPSSIVACDSTNSIAYSRTTGQVLLSSMPQLQERVSRGADSSPME
jgi:hypothetical protein